MIRIQVIHLLLEFCSMDTKDDVIDAEVVETQVRPRLRGRALPVSRCSLARFAFIAASGAPRDAQPRDPATKQPRNNTMPRRGRWIRHDSVIARGTTSIRRRSVLRAGRADQAGRTQGNTSLRESEIRKLEMILV